MTRSTFRSAVGLTGVTGLLGAGLVFAGAASASDDGPCEAVADSAVVTCTYLFTGAQQELVVPDGVTELDVVVTGAAGGRTSAALDPAPAVTVEGTLPVAPASTLFITVGGVGGDGMQATLDMSLPGGAGGFNGGAAGGATPATPQGSSTSGAGGGGASDIRLVGAGEPGSLESRLVVAAGSGGSSTTGSAAGDPTAWTYASPAADDAAVEEEVLPEDAGETTPVAEPDWAQWQLDGRYGTATAGEGGTEAGGGGGGGVFGGAGGPAGTAGTGGTSLVPAGGQGHPSTDPASVTVTYELPEGADTAPSATEPPVAPPAAETPAPVEIPAPVESPAPIETPAPVENPAPVEAAAPVEAPVETPAAVETPAPVEVPVPAESPAPIETPAAAAVPVEAPVETPAVVDTPAPAADVVPPAAATPAVRGTSTAVVDLLVQPAASETALPAPLLDADGARVLAAGVLGGLVLAVGTALAVALRRRG